jgi:cephalosporin hydroxylase
MGRFLEVAMPHADDPMSMDVGHALMIGQFIREIDATSVVEVGCCYGISTGAILDAFDERREGPCELRRKKLLHLIDIKFQQSVADMYYAVNLDTAIILDNAASLSKYADGKLPTLGRYYGEVVILDGDHSEENVMAEVDLVLSWPKPPRAIILHDTGSDGLPGPRAAVERLRSKNWSVYHNETAGPRASRGLTICVADELGGYDAAFRILELGK